MLDTEALVWWLSNISSFPEDLREKLEYYEESIVELSDKQLKGGLRIEEDSLPSITITYYGIYNHY